MLVQQNDYTIEKIVTRIRAGRLALPDFQRDFVWSPTQVVDLLESISREWPIGSLLLLKGPQPFAFRSIDSAPPVLSSELDLYVLDGQQRVTALYHAIQNASQFVYYVNLLTSSPDDDEVISWERRSTFERRYKTLSDRAVAGIALICDIWDNEQFQNWLELANRSMRSHFVSLRERRLSGLQSKVYRLLAIELEQGIELEALAKIFETLNKTGVRLNAFDLLVAKLYPTNFNLRNEWDAAKSGSALISRFDPDGLEIIKLLALLVRLRHGKHSARGVRQGDVLALNADFIAELWHEAVELYDEALATIQDFGVTSAYLIPNWSMVLGTAAWLIGPNSEGVRDWWMHRLRNQTFAQAANTRIVSDFEAIATGNFRDDTQEDVDPLDLLSLPSRPNGLLVRGTMALAILDGASDPITGDLLTDARRVTPWTLGEDGSVRPYSQETTFANMIFLADGASQKKAVSVNVSETLAGATALQSQGIDKITMRRDWRYLQRLLR